MSNYSDLIVVGGTSLYDEFGMILLREESDFAVPQAVTSWLDVPGRTQGPLDMSEALTGAPMYGKRNATYVFAVGDREKFDAAGSRLLQLLHNRRLKYTLGRDPGYVYEARFEVQGNPIHEAYQEIKVKATVDPYKSRGEQTVRIDAAGGRTVVIANGMARACPVFECSTECVVEFKGRSAELRPGSWRIPWLWLDEGGNPVYVNTIMGDGDAVLEDWWDTPLSDVWDLRLSDMMFMSERPKGDEYAVYVRYEWRDL